MGYTGYIYCLRCGFAEITHCGSFDSIDEFQSIKFQCSQCDAKWLIRFDYEEDNNE